MLIYQPSAIEALTWLQEAVHPHQEGYFTDLESLERFCLALGLPLNETNGQVMLQRVSPREAGVPLRHGPS